MKSEVLQSGSALSRSTSFKHAVAELVFESGRDLTAGLVLWSRLSRGGVRDVQAPDQEDRALQHLAHRGRNGETRTTSTGSRNLFFESLHFSEDMQVTCKCLKRIQFNLLQLAKSWRRFQSNGTVIPSENSEVLRRTSLFRRQDSPSAAAVPRTEPHSERVFMLTGH